MTTYDCSDIGDQQNLVCTALLILNKWAWVWPNNTLQTLKLEFHVIFKYHELLYLFWFFGKIILAHRWLVGFGPQAVVCRFLFKIIFPNTFSSIIIFLYNFTWVTFIPPFYNTCNEMTLSSESSPCLATWHSEGHAISFHFPLRT